MLSFRQIIISHTFEIISCLFQLSAFWTTWQAIPMSVVRISVAPSRRRAGIEQADILAPAEPLGF